MLKEWKTAVPGMEGRGLNQSERAWADVPRDVVVERLQMLRELFPPNVVGKLPRGRIQLDYVGHAAVTDRLLTVDPFWCWHPATVGNDGLPAIGTDGVLWIQLTVCGVSRLGVGDVSDRPLKDWTGTHYKQAVSDAIRNAAMRFGVALDLWTRDELESAITTRRGPSWDKTPDAPASEPAGVLPDTMAEKIYDLADKADYPAERLASAVSWASDGRTQTVEELTVAEAAKLLETMARIGADGSGGDQ